MLELVKLLVQIIFSFLGILPDMPSTLITMIDAFINLILEGASLVSLFLPMETVKILIPIVIAIVNFDKIFKLVMFIIKNIPFLGMK